MLKHDSVAQLTIILFWHVASRDVLKKGGEEGEASNLELTLKYIQIGLKKKKHQTQQTTLQKLPNPWKSIRKIFPKHKMLFFLRYFCLPELGTCKLPDVPSVNTAISVFGTARSVCIALGGYSKG